MARIVLTTEGTYPHVLGGVSTWCEQLLGGLLEHSVEVVALSVVGARVQYRLPPNVRSVRSLTIWQRRAAPQPGRMLRRAFLRALVALIGALGGDAEGLTGVGDELTFSNALERLLNVNSQCDTWELFDSACVWEAVARALGPQASAAEVAQNICWLRGTLVPIEPPEYADVAVSTVVGPGALPAWLAKIKYGSGFVLVEHGVYLRERLLSLHASGERRHTRTLRGSFYSTLCAVLYKDADQVLSVSQFGGAWQAALGAAAERRTVIPNGVSPAAFPLAAEPQGPPTVSWVGRVDPLKDLSTLIRALAHLRETVPGARLRMYGPVPKGNEGYHAALLSELGELGLREAATFEGPLNPVSGAYHAGHIVALSSVSEGFPYTVIEAMMAGRPVVGTRVGGVAEAIGDTGLVVRSQSPELLAGALASLLQDAPRRQRLGLAARERALSLYTLDRMQNLYQGLITTISDSAQEVQHERERLRGTRPRLRPV